jgi:hypothetical protein
MCNVSFGKRYHIRPPAATSPDRDATWINAVNKCFEIMVNNHDLVSKLKVRSKDCENIVASVGDVADSLICAIRAHRSFGLRGCRSRQVSRPTSTHWTTR